MEAKFAILDCTGVLKNRDLFINHANSPENRSNSNQNHANFPDNHANSEIPLIMQSPDIAPTHWNPANFIVHPAIPSILKGKPSLQKYTLTKE